MERRFTVPRNADLFKIACRGRGIVKEWGEKMSEDYIMVLTTCMLAEQTKRFRVGEKENALETALNLAKEKITTEQASFGFGPGEDANLRRTGYCPNESCRNSLRERTERTGEKDSKTKEVEQTFIRLVEGDLEMSSDGD